METLSLCTKWEREKKNRCTRKAWFKMSMKFLFESSNSKPTYITKWKLLFDIYGDKTGQFIRTVIMIMMVYIVITLIANESQVYRRVGTLPVTDGPTPPPATNFTQPTYPTKKSFHPTNISNKKIISPNQHIQLKNNFAQPTYPTKKLFHPTNISN